MMTLAKPLWLSLAVLLVSSSCGRGPNVRYGQIHFDKREVHCFDRKQKLTLYKLPQDEAALTCIPNPDLNALLTSCRVTGGGANIRYCQIFTDLAQVYCLDARAAETVYELPQDEAAVTCAPNLDLDALLKYCRIKK